MKLGVVLAGLALGLSIGMATAVPASAQTVPCVFRGELDTPFCDLNRDWLADRPIDRSRWRNPPALSFSYLASADSERAVLTFRPFVNHLTRCLGKRVLYAQMPSHGSQVEALRGGRLHVTALPVVWIPLAVNFGGGIPFAAPASLDGIDAVRIQILAHRDSTMDGIPDLRRKTLAHAASGLSLTNLVVRAAFNIEGLNLGRDYRPVFAGTDERGLRGVASRLYDAAVIGDDALGSLLQRQQVRQEDFRMVWESRAFPKIVFVHAHDLMPDLQEKLQTCFRSFLLPETMLGAMGANDRFLTVSYARELDPIRTLGERADQVFDRHVYATELRRETETRARPR